MGGKGSTGAGVQNRVDVPQEIQEKVIKYYETGDISSVKEIAAKLKEEGYDINPQKIYTWKTFRNAQLIKRNNEWENSKDQLSNELPERIKEINESMNFYRKEMDKIVKLLKKEDEGSIKYGNLLDQLTKLEKNNEIVNNKYISLLKLVEINTSAIKTEEGEARVFENIIELIRGWDESKK